ncbi:hypothetical protein C8F01DRAFT_1322471 [Mycena amicta]|nr:hypothetical protein C8F01DRAFT_1322471 [Mycena amicta]
MHRALCIDEVLQSILSHVDSPVDTGARERSLAYLARTCKTFEDPALDLLWASQDTLNCLLKCLPAEHWHEVPSNFTHWRRDWPWPIFCLHETVAKNDWGRVLHYSRRVRSLSLGFKSSSECAFPDAQTLRTIASQFADGELMPNLSSFACQEPPDDTELPAYMSLFVTPKLTELSLTALTSMDLFLPLLSLAIPFEQLERLSLLLSVVSRDDGPVPPHESSIRQIYASIIPRLHQIRRLVLVNFNAYSELKHISQLLRLEVLTIMDYSTVNLFLETLRNLMLTGCPTKVRDVVRTLRVPKCHLEHYHLPDYVVDGAALVPLFQFTNLTEVDLQTPIGFTISDATIWDMARSWPEITTLTLKAASQMQIRPITTLDALRAFARHCRKLEFLTMPVDATVAPALDNFVLEHPSQLGQLEIHNSPITSARVSDIARFIFSLFPNIKAVQGPQEDLPAWWSRPREEPMEQTEPRWEEVWDVIWALRTTLEISIVLYMPCVYF